MISERKKALPEKYMPTPETAVFRDDAILDVRGLKKYFPIRKGFFRKSVSYVRAVDDINLFVRQGETLGLVGESGCGKTTTGRTIIRLLEPTEGEIFFKDPQMGWVDMAMLERRELSSVRRHMQFIFQDPYSSLDPRMTVERIVSEPLRINKTIPNSQIKDRVVELLDIVGLRPEYLSRYPHAFSGGQRQRVGIARALALNPQLIICDEPVSALDVSIQAQVLNLLEELQEQLGFTYIFVAHDLSVVEHISDRVAVMYVGKIVELAKTADLYEHPLHPYTEALMAAVPKPDPLIRERPIRLPGDVASSSHPPSGCYFHPRCQYAQEICSKEAPILEEVKPDHFVSCHFARQLNLQGVIT